MKKLLLFAMIIAALGIFNACEKSDELIDQSIDEKLLDATNPDVYSENGYLVFKSVDILDSIATVMNKMTDEELWGWEHSLKFKSARTYREKLNDEIFSTENYVEFKKKIDQASVDGYYNKKDSCMDYPFSIYSWASVLNKDGIVGIGDFLYSFRKNDQIIIYKGTPDLIKMVQQGKELSGEINISRFRNTLKSVILDDYGSYYKQEKKDGKDRLKVYLQYNEIKVKKPVYDPKTHGTIIVSLPDAVKIDLYCHQEHKGTFGWRDSKTHLYHKGYRVDIGGNYVQEKNFTYGRVNYSDSSPNILQSPNDLSNHYINLYWSQYPFDLIEYQDAPPSPKVTHVDFDIWTGKVGSENDHIDFILN